MMPNDALAAVVFATVFGGAAWFGCALGALLARDAVRFDDGPPESTFSRWPFALLGALAGAAVSLRTPAALEVTMLVAVVGLLAAAAAADLRCGLIPDACSLGALATVLGLAAVRHDWAPAAGAALIAVAFGAVALVSRGRGMGWGDVKLAAAGGALLGTFDATLALALAACAAYAVARRSGRTHEPIAFGPYIAASTVVALALVSPV